MRFHHAWESPYARKREAYVVHGKEDSFTCGLIEVLPNPELPLTRLNAVA